MVQEFDEPPRSHPESVQLIQETLGRRLMIPDVFMLIGEFPHVFLKIFMIAVVGNDHLILRRVSLLGKDAFHHRLHPLKDAVGRDAY